MVIIFDGAGTRWVPALSEAEHPDHELYTDLRPVIAGACDYCSNAFKVRQQVVDAGVRLLDEYKGHPSVKTLVDRGFEIITF